MRIEDIDKPRVVPGSADAICRDHEWLGLEWDEGPTWQSTRDAAYEKALDELRDAGLVYPCTCSRKEIAEIASAPHDGEGPRYPGTCREGVTRPDRAPALRFRFEDPSPGFDDLVFGRQPPGALVTRSADARSSRWPRSPRHPWRPPPGPRCARRGRARGSRGARGAQPVRTRRAGSAGARRAGGRRPPPRGRARRVAPTHPLLVGHLLSNSAIDRSHCVS